jgi:hypothetical protein
MGNEDRSRERHPEETSHRCRDASKHGSRAATPAAHGGVAEQRRQPPVTRPPSDALVQVQPLPPTRLSRNGQRAGLLLRSSGFDPLEAYHSWPRRGVESPSPRQGEDRQFEPGRGRNKGAPLGRAWARGEPTRFESGRPATSRPGSSTLPPSATSGPMERYPSWTRGRPGKAVGGPSPCVGSSPTLSAYIEEAIRMVEEPGLNPGSTPGVDAWEFYLPPVRHAWELDLSPEGHAHLAVAHQDRAPPSEGGGSTFESCRRGQRPCSSTVEHTFGMGEDWVRSPARALLTRSHRPPGRRRDGSAPTRPPVPPVDLAALPS